MDTGKLGVTLEKAKVTTKDFKKKGVSIHLNNIHNPPPPLPHPTILLAPCRLQP
jgi:hypothetical protein